MSEKLEVNIEGKLFAFSTKELSCAVREELLALFYPNGQRKRVSVVELLQAYIIAAEKYAKIHSSLESLYHEIENASIPPQNIIPENHAQPY
ncbi:hypothetical protein [uncultured Helicobacter sp.]|uniref:hypothetical protein n=1 Tax=uncultured Helicobacter sp. TaxID=175537 RepID=UPI001C3A8FF2|nr:hypothetical protein [Candidatus Helicobacter avicola]